MFSTPFTFLKQPSGGGGFDPDAQAFFNAVEGTGASLTTTEKDAVNTLTESLKTNSLYSKMKALWPVVGSVYDSHKFNLIDPRDLDAAYRLTDIGTDPITHTSDGFNGTANTNATAVDTHLIPGTVFADRTFSYGYYCNSAPTLSAGADNYLMGAYNSSTAFNALQIGGGANETRSQFTGGGSTNNAVIPTDNITSKYQGFTMASGEEASGNAFALRYRSNFDQTGSNTGTLSGTAATTVSFYLCNLNFNNTIYSGYHGDGQVGRICFAFAADYLTTAEADIFKVLVQDFQTTLGRQV